MLDICASNIISKKNSKKKFLSSLWEISHREKIVGKHLDMGKYKVFFFGSRVSEKGDEWSDDIDV